MASHEPHQPQPGTGISDPTRIVPAGGDPFAAMLGAAHGSHTQAGPWQPPAPEELQRDFPQYEIRGILGRGGMGAVYQGWQRSLDRLVAIKILPPGLDDGISGFTERFKREAKAMARLQHPGIVTVFDAGTTPSGLLYFVMECITGTDVQQLVRQQGRLDPAEALRITAAVCDALAYAHEHGIIHRDIKPSNIMLDARGTVKVADFGLAKTTAAGTTLLTRSEVTMGTPEFMAPEALKGVAQVDHRADLYAVGVMLYQMLTGELPRGRFEPPSRAVKGLDRRLDAIVDKALQSAPADRWSTATEITTAITPVLTKLSNARGATRPPGALSITRNASTVAAAPHAPSRRISPLRLALAAVLIAALGVGGWLAFGKRGKAADPPAEALKLAGVAPSVSPTWQRTDFTTLTLQQTDQKVVDGRLHISSHHALRPDPVAKLQDAAMRASLVWKADTGDVKLSSRYLSSSETVKLPATTAWFARFTATSVSIGTTDNTDTNVRSIPLNPPIAVGDKVTLKFASIGRRHLVWVNDRLIGEATSEQFIQKGFVRLSAGEALFDSFEHINLDGLPEAEALKLVGVSQPSAAAIPPPYPTTGADGEAVFPPGVWTRLWTAAEEAATIERKDGDWALLNAHSHGRSTVFTNVGLRARFRGQRVKDDNFPQFNLRAATGAGTSLNLYIIPSGDKLALRQPPLSRDKPALAELRLAEKLKPGTEYTMEFYAIGQTVIGRVNGQTQTAVLPAPATSGKINLYSANADFLRDVEVLNLDGLPEPEALKLAGVSAAPGLPVVKSSAAGTEAPYPAVDKEGKVVFPPGIWARTLAREVETEGLAKPATKRDGPWLIWHTGAYEGRCSALNIEVAPMKNLGLRARFRGQRVNGEDFPQLTVRKNGDTPSPNLHIRDGKMKIRLNQPGYPVLADAVLREPLTPGKEYLAEFYAIGPQLIARVNGQALTTRTDKPPVAGTFQIYGAQWDYFKDAEAINLDGLPEAEALKLAGVEGAAKPPAK